MSRTGSFDSVIQYGDASIVVTPSVIPPSGVEQIVEYKNFLSSLKETF